MDRAEQERVTETWRTRSCLRIWSSREKPNPSCAREYTGDGTLMSGAGPIDWDATLGGGREVAQPERTELTEPRPWIVTGDEAAAFAEDMRWSVFPARIRVDEDRGK